MIASLRHMPSRARLTACAGALGALSLVGAAPAAAPVPYKPQMIVRSASAALGASGVRVTFVSAQQHDPTAALRIAVPRGYTVKTTGVVGSRIGTAVGRVYAADLRRAVDVRGSLEVAPRSEFADRGPACTGTSSFAAVWALHVIGAGFTYRVPIFVERVSSGPLASIASATLTLCMPAPDVPRGTPNRAEQGSRLLNVTLATRNVTNPTKGALYRWRATATPYRPGEGTLNANATVETQSISVLPVELQLSATRGAGNKVTVTGSLTANGEGVTGTFVDLLQGKSAGGLKKVATLPTKQRGTFGATGSLPGGGALYLAARADQADKDLGAGGCVATFKPPLSQTRIPCVQATLPGFTVASKTIRVG